MADGVGAEAGAGGEEGGLGAVFDEDAASASEVLWVAVLEVREAEHGFEGAGEGWGDGTVGEDDAEVSPSLVDSVAYPFLTDVETTDEGELVIADEEFTVVTIIEVAEGEGIEPTDLAAGLAEVGPETVGEQEGTEGIEEDADLDGALGGLEEGLLDEAAGFGVGVDIDFQIDGMAGMGDGIEDGVEGLMAGVNPPPGVWRRNRVWRGVDLGTVHCGRG